MLSLTKWFHLKAFYIYHHSFHLPVVGKTFNYIHSKSTISLKLGIEQFSLHRFSLLHGLRNSSVVLAFLSKNIQLLYKNQELPTNWRFLVPLFLTSKKKKARFDRDKQQHTMVCSQSRLSRFCKHLISHIGMRSEHLCLCQKNNNKRYWSG